MSAPLRVIEPGRRKEQRLYVISIAREGRTREQQRHEAARVEVWAWDMYGALKEALSYLAHNATEPRLGAEPLDVKIPRVIAGRLAR